MTQTLLFLLTVLRALVEVAGLSRLGQGVVGLLAGRRREENFIYRIFQVTTRPARRAAQAVLPAGIIDRSPPMSPSSCHLALACPGLAQAHPSLNPALDHRESHNETSSQ